MNETSCGADLRQRINDLLDKITSEEDLERVYKFAKYDYIVPTERSVDGCLDDQETGWTQTVTGE